MDNMKPRLTVLVGSGGSVEIGIPSTADLLPIATNAIQNSPAIVSPDSPVLLPEVAQSLLKRCKDYYGPQMTFEHLMHVLETLDSMGGAFRTPAPSTGKAAEPMLAAAPHPEIIDALDRYFAHSAPTALLYAIHKRISAASEQVSSHPSWPAFIEFWRSLDSTFDLSIGTINYETTVEQALSVGPQAQGFAQIEGEGTWRLDERNVRENLRLAHLHGSIHFGDREYGTDANRFVYQDDWEDLYWHPDPRGARQSLGNKSTHRSQGRRQSVKGPLITGLDKADKLIVEPYGTYLREFAEWIRTCPRLLVIGYGFGDLHINALIRRMGRLHGPNRRIAVVTKFDPVWMRGAWASRNIEATLFHMWSEDRELLEPFKYSNPLSAKTGYVQVFYDGLLDAAQSHQAELEEFLLN